MAVHPFGRGGGGRAGHLTLVLLALISIHVVTDYHSAVACQFDACSNDRLGILGDERLTWDPVTNWGLDDAGNPSAPGQYEVWREGEAQACDVLPPDDWWLDVYCSNCLMPNGQHRLSVRACNAAGHCGDPSAPVEFLTYACLRTNPCVFSDDNDARNDSCQGCEYPCFAGAPRRMPNLPLCE